MELHWELLYFPLPLSHHAHFLISRVILPCFNLVWLELADVVQHSFQWALPEEQTLGLWGAPGGVKRALQSCGQKHPWLRAQIHLEKFTGYIHAHRLVCAHACKNISAYYSLILSMQTFLFVYWTYRLAAYPKPLVVLFQTNICILNGMLSLQAFYWKLRDTVHRVSEHLNKFTENRGEWSCKYWSIQSSLTFLNADLWNYM